MVGGWILSVSLRRQSRLVTSRRTAGSNDAADRQHFGLFNTMVLPDERDLPSDLLLVGYVTSSAGVFALCSPK
jgi:hypothetical protein